MELPKDFENVIIKIRDYYDKDVAKIVIRGGKICEGELSGCWVYDLDGTDDTSVYKINLEGKIKSRTKETKI